MIGIRFIRKGEFLYCREKRENTTRYGGIVLCSARGNSRLVGMSVRPIIHQLNLLNR